MQATLLDSYSSIQDRDLKAAQLLPTTLTASQFWLTTSIRSKLVSHITELGFDWDADVEAVYEGIDSIEMFDAWKARPASSNFRWILRPKQDVSVEHISACLKKCLEAHSALRAIVVPLEHDTVFPSAPHVLRSCDRWLDQLARVVELVDNVDSLQEFAQAPTSPFAHGGGPCFKAQVVPEAGSARPGLFLAVNHAVFDAVSTTQFLDDLAEMLAGTSTEPRTLVPYSVFANMYHLHKDGAAGKASTSYQMDKFQQLDGIEAYLWPPSKGPDLMIGDDAGRRHWDGSLANQRTVQVTMKRQEGRKVSQ